MKTTTLPLKHLTLLCVEDDPLIAKGLVETLYHFVKVVLWARNGTEGLELFTSHRIDIVFTDIIMEEGDGIALIEHIRLLDTHVPIVAISSYKEFDGMQRLMDKKLTGFISKPFVFEAVYSILLECAKQCDVFMILGENIHFYPEQMMLTCKGSVIYLTALEQKFLLFALKSQKTVMTKHAIESCVWENETMSDDALKTLIKRLRAKTGMTLVKAIPDVGYVLNLEGK